MKSFVSSLLIVFFSMGLFAGSVQAIDYGTLVKVNEALRMIENAQKLSEKYSSKNENIDDYVEVPAPQSDSGGKFVLPYTQDGVTTEWAQKTLTAQASAAVAGKASDAAVDKLAAKVPFGSAFSGGLKSKSKGVAAVTAIGGWDFIRETSDASLNKLEDYAVYLHMTYSDSAEYQDALAAAMAVYPKLEKAYQPAINKAYKNATKAAKKAAKEKAAAEKQEAAGV